MRITRADFNGLPSAALTARPETVHGGGAFSVALVGIAARLWAKRMSAVAYRAMCATICPNSNRQVSSQHQCEPNTNAPHPRVDVSLMYEFMQPVHSSSEAEVVNALVPGGSTCKVFKNSIIEPSS